MLLNLLTLLALALALAMDAFAAALCSGAAARPAPGVGGALRIGLTFGAAQAIMPAIGWGLGLAFASMIREIDHWVAFILLAFIGARMLKEGLSGGEEDSGCESLPTGWPLIATAVATSIDAAAAGVTLAFLDQSILVASAVIGTVTLILSAIGVMLGAAAGAFLGKRAEIAGGLILIALGTKILIEHLFFGG